MFVDFCKPPFILMEAFQDGRNRSFLGHPSCCKCLVDSVTCTKLFVFKYFYINKKQSDYNVNVPLIQTSACLSVEAYDGEIRSLHGAVV